MNEGKVHQLSDIRRGSAPTQVVPHRGADVGTALLVGVDRDQVLHDLALTVGELDQHSAVELGETARHTVGAGYCAAAVGECELSGPWQRDEPAVDQRAYVSRRRST